jgi:hypothetical protein
MLIPSRGSRRRTRMPEHLAEASHVLTDFCRGGHGVSVARLSCHVSNTYGKANKDQSHNNLCMLDCLISCWVRVLLPVNCVHALQKLSATAGH